MITLVDQHAENFEAYSRVQRLAAIGMTPAKYARLCRGFKERKIRESAIPEEDIEAATDFFVQNPEIGAGRAHCTLIDRQSAWISTTSLNDIKQEIADLAQQAYRHREQEKKQLEEQLHKDLKAKQGDHTYHHVQALAPNHIWSIDFTELIFLGMPFQICVVYDEFSQYYPALLADFTANSSLAAKALASGLRETGRTPALLRRDNGAPFITSDFQNLLKPDSDYPIPPGSPWYNGSLESNNTSLKVSIKTAGILEMGFDSKPFRHARQNRRRACALLQEILNRVRHKLNSEIARQKHRTTPDTVYHGQQQSKQIQSRTFAQNKAAQRKKRMQHIRSRDIQSKTPSLSQKVTKAFNKIAQSMSTDSLFALNEAIHGHYTVFQT